MALKEAVGHLRKEQRQLERRLERVNNALQVLNHVFGKRGRKRSVNGRRKPRRKMSQAARKRIAAAQRARWAKLRKRRG